MSNIENNSAIVSICKPHTKLKFQLVEEYITRWSQILASSNKCKTLVYVDPMSNSGIYKQKDESFVDGTAIRVARILYNLAERYSEITTIIYFNDINHDKIDRLKSELKSKNISNTSNFQIQFSDKDKYDFSKYVGNKLRTNQITDVHSFLFYDPYDADIDWTLLDPFINRWGEVLINHMVSDPVRGMSQAKDKLLVYEKTYNEDSQTLKESYGSNYNLYQDRIKEIIRTVRKFKPNDYRIAAFPFFTKTNGLLYELVHLSPHDSGFNTFKECAWKTFGGYSSNKNKPNDSLQIKLNLGLIGIEDPNRYTIEDIADFLIEKNRGKKHLFLNQLYEPLKSHSVFPYKCFRREIKILLVEKGVIKTKDQETGKEVYDFTGV